MDKLKQCAISFLSLLKFQYQFLAGSKQTLIDFTLFFSKEHFMHLIGLHKLTDIQQLQRQRKDRILDIVLNNELSYELIQKSAFFPEIKERILLFPFLETALDSSKLIIKYKQGFASGSLIYEHSDTTLHLFIDKDEESGLFCGKSFFGRTDNKYIKGQQTFKILQKNKTDIKSKTKYILIDRLKSKGPYSPT